MDDEDDDADGGGGGDLGPGFDGAVVVFPAATVEGDALSTLARGSLTDRFRGVVFARFLTIQERPHPWWRPLSQARTWGAPD